MWADFVPNLSLECFPALDMTLASGNPEWNHGSVAEPIAIVGMGCRFPGGINSPAGFWELLVNGRNGIAAIPANRWNRDAYYSADRAHAGKLISRQGGSIDDIDLFDPGFFGISDTEAPYIDPQHRLLLEVTWEAFERAGLLMEHYRGQPVGVFIGCFTSDYLHIQFANHYEVGAYTATGAIATMVAARISHTFDFRGPSMSIDTACSSSLHSVHLACESLRARDSDVAVAGGTQLTLIPEFNIAETKAGFLSDASQCRMFDAGARGYVRSEGIGVVVLKRLPDALAAGDPIHAVILGSAMNQDGRTPSIAQPNTAAQKEVMARACVRARIQPAAVRYVEAHGTGTLAGDRAEAEAIGAVFRADPACSTELLVGSVKSNLGHAEAAAGICGLIKTALCVKHRTIPPNLHFEIPNPAIDLEHLHIRVPVAVTPLPSEPMLACINSFGFGGSNAAVVIRSASDQECARPAPQQPQSKPFLIPASALSASALRESATRMETWLQPKLDEIRLEDLCYTAGARRSHHPFRRAFVVSELDALRQQLASFAIEGSDESPAVNRSEKGTVWVFSGAGNQRFRAGLQLLREEAVFRAVVERCDEIYRGLAGFSLIEVMRSGPPDEYIREAWLSHPVTVSIQLGLASLFRSWGIQPAAILGHSLGETAAFHAAGVYDLEQTLQLVFHRCECLKPLHESGGLLAVSADEASIRRVLDLDSGDLAVAAMNGPAAITLSAHGPSLGTARKQLDGAGIRCKVLAESFACHHRYAALESAAAGLKERMAAVQASKPHTLLYSTATGAAVDSPPAPAHWEMHLLETVKFQTVVSMLDKSGFQRYLELGPHPALSSSIAATLKNKSGRVFASLNPHVDERTSLLNCLGGLYEVGESIDWQALYPSGEVLDLPAYPWQRRRFWREPEASVRHRTRPSVSRLLGERVQGGAPAWRAEVSVEQFPFLIDHRIAGEPLFPAAGLIDMALGAGQQHFAGYPFAIKNLRFLKAVPLHRGSALFMELHLDEAHGVFSIYATPSLTDPSSQRVCEGELRSLPPTGPSTADTPAIDLSASRQFDGDALYEQFARLRYDYRGAFRGIRYAWVNGNDALCEIELPADLATEGYSFHPAALDAAFQALLCIRVARGAEDRNEAHALEVPDSIGSIRLHGKPDARSLVWASVRDTASGSVAEIRIFDRSRRLTAQISEFKTRRVERMTGSLALSALDRCLYRTMWLPAPPRSVPIAEAMTSGEQAAWVILSNGDAGEQFARRIEKSGQTAAVLGSWRGQGITPAIRPPLEEILDRMRTVAGVIHLGNLEFPGDPAHGDADNGKTCCASLLSVARTLAMRGDHPKLWVVTAGAHRLKPSDLPADPFQAASWGFCRAIGQREMPGIWGGLIDVSGQCLPSEIDLAADTIFAPDGEDQFAIREQERFMLRLHRMPSTTAARPPNIAFRHDGAYLVTGAFGALGGLVARWMVAHGARRLILPDHRDDAHRRAALIAELESAGAAIEVVLLDLSNAARVAEYCNRRQREQRPPICGVMYCAGRSQDQLAAAMDRATFDGVFNTKAAGAWALHHALRNAPLEHFVLFSSAASVLPNPGMGAYAAANGFLDALASHRRSLGLPGLSIAWGPWEIGMTERRGIKEYLDSAGFQSFTAPQAMQFLEHLWYSEAPEPMALSVDWGRAATRGRLTLPILNDLLREIEPGEGSTASSDRGGATHNGEHSPKTSTAEKRLRTHIAELLSARMQFDIAVPLVNQGLDSLGATVLTETLYREFGLSVEADEFAAGLSFRDLADRVAGAALRGDAKP